MTPSANPVLAELVRGDTVETIHRGAFAVCDAAGRLVLSAGDVARPVFPRSAIKAMQALALFRSGAAERFGLSAEDLAIACASHHGEPAHEAVARHLLAASGCAEADLECGAHPPTNAAAREALRAEGRPPGAIHNNCSGKHAGMLAVAKALGAETAGYSGRDHPVQRLVRDCVEAAAGTAMHEDRCGIDGCSIPTWAAPLETFATGFARMARGQGLDPDLAAAARALLDAATAHPHLIAGTGAFDTDAMEVFEGRLMLKVGAEGVFCGALRDRGLGFALKCDDGSIPAAETMTAALLARIAEPSAAEAAVLSRFSSKTLRNWRGLKVATLRAAAG